MKLHLQELKPYKTVTISGSEEWLERIYGDFPPPKGAERPKLTGELTARLEEGGSVKVTGEISYAPYVTCSRCSEPLQWALDFRLDMRYFPDFAAQKEKDKTLSKGELDEYYIENEEVDLEVLINDNVQTAFPTQIKPEPDEQDRCRVCHRDLSGAQVYGPRETEETQKERSPFAVLKDFKPKH